jgi:hypothetical protein
VLVGGLLLDCDPRIPDLCTSADGNKPPKFLEGILRRNGANDGGNYFDGISFHAYDYYSSSTFFKNRSWNSSWNTTGPVLIPKAEYIKDVLNQYGVTGKFLMNTETALICGGAFAPPGGPGCDSDPSSPFEQAKANYVAQGYASAIAEGLRANIWYNVFGWRNSALLNYNLTERPAYIAFVTARNILLNAQFSREITDYAGVKIYEFTRDWHRIWVLWSLDGSSHSVNIDNMPNEIYDALGNRVFQDTPLQVGSVPLYLVWHP